MDKYLKIQKESSKEQIKLSDSQIGDQIAELNFIYNGNNIIKTDKVHYHNELLYVDPQTVATIISIGSKIYDIFSKQNDDSSDLSNIAWWVAEIRQELNQINTSLIDIRNILYELKIKMDDNFREDVEKELLGAVMAYGTIIEDFKANPGNERLNQIMNNIYSTILEKRGHLMGYGYASTFTLMYAMRVETDLVSILGIGKSTLKNTISTYDSFLNYCINDQNSGSFYAASINYRNILDRLQNNWQPGHKGTIRFPPHNVHSGALWYQDNPRHVCHPHEPHGGHHRLLQCKWEYDRWKWIPGFIANGDILNGFTLEGTHEISPGYFERYNDPNTPQHTFANLDDGMAEVNRVVQNKIKPIFDKATVDYRDNLIMYNGVNKAKEFILGFKNITQDRLSLL